MPDNNFDPKEKTPANKAGRFVRKNGISILLGIVIVVLFVSPDAKSWVLQQLMRTGIFNARIEGRAPDASGQAVVDFSFEDERGSIQHTSSLRGKVVFINFWASWCPPCRAEMPSIEKLYARLKNNPDVFFLTVNEDNDVAAAHDFLKSEKYSIPVYKTNGSVPAAIYAGTLPTTAVLDREGNIRLHHEGFANYGSKKFAEQIEKLINE